MRITDKLVATGIIYMMIFSIYMIWSDEPIVYKYFWRTYFYMMIYSLPMIMFILILPLCVNNPLAKFLCIALVVFFGGFIAFNLRLINEDSVSFHNYCTSQVYRYVFTCFIALLIIVSFIIKCFAK